MKTEIEVDADVREKDKAGLMLHTEIATGSYGEKDFRMIMGVQLTRIRVEYDGMVLDITTEDLANSMLQAIEAS